MTFGTALLDFLLPAGCMSCRRWIPSGETAGGRRALVCFRCRARLQGGSWPRCGRCHAPRGTGRDLTDPDSTQACLECRGWPADLTAARHAYVLAPPATDLVHALKYEGWRELAGFMGVRMAAAALGQGAEPPAGAAEKRHPTEFRDVPARWPVFIASAVVVPIPTTQGRLRSRGYNQAALLADVAAVRLGRPLVSDALVRARAGASQTALSPERRRENVRGAFEGGGSEPRMAGQNVLLVDDVLTTGATGLEAAKTLRAAGAREVRLLTFGRALPGRDRGEEAA